MHLLHNIQLIRPLFSGGRFANPFPTYTGQKLTQHLQWYWNRKNTKAPLPLKHELEDLLPLHPVSHHMHAKSPGSHESKIILTWIGQSTILVQMGGLNILTDPIFSEYASPVSFAGPRRLRPPPIGIHQLPRIDAVIVSHDHYDHLDLPSVRKLGNNVKWFVPLGMGKWLAAAGITNAVEFGWWSRIFYKGVEFIATPAQHWSGRSPLDQWRSLWCGWAVHAPNSRFYFCGDTGYCDAFKQVGNELGPFDLAAIPIGGYEPRWFMKSHHMSPEDAVLTHIDLRAKQSVGIHWGTFVFTDEHIMDPPAKLQEYSQHKNTNCFVTRLGETIVVENKETHSHGNKFA